jgi:hypothetical protein
MTAATLVQEAPRLFVDAIPPPLHPKPGGQGALGQLNDVSTSADKFWGRLPQTGCKGDDLRAMCAVSLHGNSPFREG